MLVETESPEVSLQRVPRWDLYRLLADPVRVRLLGLVAEEELAVGELAELLGESQPKISRHGAALREAHLVVARKHGTWVLLSLAPGVDQDAVVQDALATGRALITEDGTLGRALDVVRARDLRTREFFDKPSPPREAAPFGELAAYLSALAPLISPRALAVDAGTGDGALLEVLAPVYDHVIAVDRSEAQLESARARAQSRGLTNVSFVCDELGGKALKKAVSEQSRQGADLVFASRVLHHAPQPAQAVSALASLLKKPSAERAGGALVVLDYAPHEDDALQQAEADVWLGFAPRELLAFAKKAGLEGATVRALPQRFRGDGPDKNVDWHVLVARQSRNEQPNRGTRT